VLLLKKRLWNLALRYYYRTVTTKAFTSFAVFHERAKGPARRQVMGYDTMELMVHPGHSDFENETRLLEKDWQGELGWSGKLITYHDL
jgi:hypothetical protein